MESPPIKCLKCQTEFPAKPPQPRANNAPNFGMVYITYERGVECPTCGAYYVPVIADAQLLVNWMQTERPADAPRVLPVPTMPAPLRSQ